MQYRADIDGLRALAIIPVVLFHAGLGFHGGFVGVDVFFVISGYLLSKIVIQEVEEKRFSFLQFYERRFRRLAPAFIATLAVCYLISWAIMLPEDFETFARSALGSIFFYANFHFYHTIDYFSQSANLMPLLHTWSLAIEEQFYLVLPISVVIALWVFPRRWLPGLIVLALLASFALCVYYTNAHRPYAFYLPHTRAWELLAGTVLAALPSLRGSEKAANWIGGAALITLAVVIVTFDEQDAFPGWVAAAPVVATAALIYCGEVASKGWSARLLALPPLVFIGKISYSLYLWHWPVIVFARYADLAPDSLATRLGCVGVSVLLATVSWALIEQPIRRRKIFVSMRSVYSAAAASTLAMALIAGAIIRYEGLPNRVPENLRQLQALTQEDAEQDAACFFRSLKIALSASPCLRGATAQDPSFLLIGDSHANALSPGLFDAAQKANLAGLQFTAPGLFPGLGLRDQRSSRPDPRAQRLVEIVMDKPSIKTVFISAAWADYATGQNWKGQSWLFQDDSSIARSSQDNAAIVARSIRRLVAEMPGKHIVLFDDVPAGQDLDLNFFLRRSMLKSLNPQQAAVSQDHVQARRDAYVPLLEDIAADFEHVHFLPVFSDFCTGAEGCALFAPDGVTPMYRDGDHLSRFGAESLSETFLSKVFEPLTPLP